jgi:integrase
MSAAVVVDADVGFRTIACPPDAAHRVRVIVLDPRAQVHVPLTVFANRSRQQLSAGSARGYLAALLPFIRDAERIRQLGEDDSRWRADPSAVRRLLADYLNDRYACVIRQHRIGFQIVARTAGTRSGVGLFLAAVKFFYRVMREEGLYPHDNPLVDRTSVGFARLDWDESRRAPRMPDHSGVVVPHRRARFTDSYFKLIGDDWVPQIVDDPTLPTRVLAGGRAVGWGLREECVARILFESGARVSEVVGLTLGDWHARGLRQEASAFSKGSHGRRIKFVRFSGNTAKLLRRYFDGERRQHDAQHRKLNDFLAGSERGLVDLSQVPVFLSSQRTALKANHFRDNFWTPACRAAGIDADVHQARHWYVTMAIRQIHETARTEAEVKRRSRELIAYMKWRQGWQTMQSYDHYFDAGRHAEIQDELHRQFERSLQVELSALKRRQRERRTTQPEVPRDSVEAARDPRTAFLESLLQ